ncbi:MAG: sn-glycerol-1-phosphate dehydrogenase [Clostridia bacterium]|nr:sn-glycerol-1-phosphate dehydrogenase [Clostridia bacterium]
MNINELDNIKRQGCSCGREHTCKIDDIIIGGGAINRLPEVVGRYSAKKVFVMSDRNTFKAAGERVLAVLSDNGIAYTSYVLDEAHPKPYEATVGSFVLHYDYECDLIIAAGSGVINDCAKFLAAFGNTPYIIVATAPSMDGYASATSSMERDGVKVSINNKCADVIIGDTDILCQAPMRMLLAGLGDIVAKYTAICDWRISNLVTGEYYCEEVAKLVRSSLKKCVDNAEGLTARDPKAVEAVFEAMVVSGVSMTYAGMSRPASGIEHSISHICDMRALEFGTPSDLHGIQCAVGTLIGVKCYEELKKLTPDREKALSYAREFDYSKWSEVLVGFVGKGGESMVKLEKKEHKYDLDKHRERLERIIAGWDTIKEIIEAELPTASELEALYDTVGMPKSLGDIGIDEDILPLTYAATRDIRDKYVQSRLMWDMGYPIIL